MVIQTLEEYNNLKIYTPFSFLCKNCGKLVSTKKRDSLKLQESQRKFLCRVCNLKKTNLEKYGVEYVSQSKEIKEKQRQTNLERYGVDFPSQSKEIKDKVKQTNLERYGVEYVSQSKEVKDKQKQTSLERYGFENPSQSEEIKEKIRQTNLERYGVEYPIQSGEVKEKQKQTCLERYGVENVFQSKEVKETIRQTNLEKYGVENPIQSEEVKSKVKSSFTEEKKLKVKETIKTTWSRKTEEEKLEFSQRQKEIWNSKSEEEKLEIRRKSNKHKKYVAQDSERFDSSWELAYYEYCKSKGYIITREPIALEYFYDNKKHLYFPDFLVNGKLVEVKGNNLKDKDGKWICPFKDKKLTKEYLNGLYEAKHQCAIKNNVTILYQEDLIALGIKV